jgi:hypothetical protein
MLNLHDLPNVLDWCKQNYETWHYEWDWGNHGYQNCLPHFNFVEHPRYLSIRNLPDDRKALMNTMLDQQYLKFKNMKLPEWEQWAVENIKGIKNVLNQPQETNDWQIFIDNTRASDKFRNIDIKEFIPWMEDRI